MKLAELVSIPKSGVIYSVSALKDELTLRLSSVADYNIDIKTGHIEIYHKYYEYGRKILFLINLAKEIPVFELNKTDLSPVLISQLADLDEKTLNEVIVEAIANLYESIAFDYFHKNGVRGKIKWKIVK